MARAFHDRWLMCYGVPVWATTDNGTEFGGAFRHQLERLGVQLVHSAPYHPQSNGTVERVVRTMKTILAAKVVDAMQDGLALLLQVQGEYMSRVHAVTGYSSNQLVFSHAVKMPPPVGGLLWDCESYSISSRAAYVQECDARSTHYAAAAYDNILRSQERSMERQARQIAAKTSRGRKPLQPGDLAYLMEPTGRNGKRAVSGPFVVEGIASAASGAELSLRSTERVRGQEVKRFRANPALVARCNTVVDALEDLLWLDGRVERVHAPSVDALAAWHSDPSVV